MTTIIRVKRHRNEDPVEALILSCKRKRTEDKLPNTDGDSFEKILNFSGTIEEKDDKIAASTVESFVKSSKYSELKSKEHIPDIRLKQRKIWRERSGDNRFTLLSCLRSSNGFENADDLENPDENSEKSITIVDVSKEETERASDNNRSDKSYVYDLYSGYFDSETDYKEFNNLYKDNLVSVQPWNFEWDYEYRDTQFDDEIDPDEDDSNDENNWRNDYPDSDPDNTQSMDEEDDGGGGDRLAQLVKGFRIDDDYELSSDSGEEKYCNYEDGDNYYYCEAQDVAGRKYAKFKANAMKQMIENDDDDDKDSEEDDGYVVEEEDDNEDDDDEYRDCEDFPSYYEDKD